MLHCLWGNCCITVSPSRKTRLLLLIENIAPINNRLYHTGWLNRAIFHNKVFVLLTNIRSPENENIDNLLLKFLIKLAGVYLPSRLEQCARKVGVAYEGSRVGNQRSRWGSCSSRKVISLNWRILLLDYLIGEYVLYHELAHLKHMNHSQKYWKHVETTIPDFREQQSWLKRNARMLTI